jgi:hypothetical protein
MYPVGHSQPDSLILEKRLPLVPMQERQLLAEF